MATRSAFVKLGAGASVVGAIMIILWAILQFAVKAQIGGLSLLLVIGIVLVIGGIIGGVTVSRTDPNT
jgi:hypothetical protein